MIASGYGTVGRRAVEWPEVIGRCWDSLCIVALVAIGCALIYALWWLVLDALGDVTSSRTKGLLALLGSVTEEEIADGHTRTKVRMTGLLGTLGILTPITVACIAISSQRVEYHAGDSAADRGGEPTMSWGDLPPYLQQGEKQTAKPDRS